MAADSFKFVGEPRTQSGKGAVRRLRREDKVPAIVYGADKAPANIMLSHNEVMKTLTQEAIFSHILTLKVGQEEEMVIIKGLQRHIYKPRILHMDFQRIKATEKITMRIPIHFLGENLCPGTKQGGIISHLRSELEIRCLPADLPEFIEIDVSQLELDQAIHLSDLKLPQGVELATAIVDEEHDISIVNVAVPKVSKEDLEAEAAEAAKAAEAAAAAGTAAPAAEGAAPEAAKPAEGAEPKAETGKKE
jgi:large subunit ribosomal protein L25